MPRNRFFLLVLLFSIVAYVRADETSNIDNGVKQFGSFHGGDIDHVSLATGALSVHIPVFSYPQRGQLKSLDFVLTLNSNRWFVQSQYNAQNVQYYQWLWGSVRNVKGLNLTASPSVFVKRHRTWSVDPSGNLSDCCGQDDPDSYYVVSPNGGAHKLYEYSTPTTTSATFLAVDGSGFRFDLTRGCGTDDSSCVGDSDTGVVTDRNGNRYSLDILSPTGAGAIPKPSQLQGYKTAAVEDLARSTQVEDTNGNLITGGSAAGSLPFQSITDTLGRSYSAVVSTGTSGCPTSPTPVGTVVVTIPAYGGGTTQVVLCEASYTFSSSGLTNSPSATLGTASQTMFYAALLPNGTKWLFSYNGNGNLSSITLPSGGMISYSWSAVSKCKSKTTDFTSVQWAVHTRTVNDLNGTSGQWTYSYGTLGSDGSHTTTVTDPQNNDVVYTFSPEGAVGGDGCSLYETQGQYYQGTSPSRTLLKTTTTAYSTGYLPSSVTTTWAATGESAQTQTDYDHGYAVGTNYIPLGDPVQRREYGFDGSLIRKTLVNYIWQSNNSYLTSNLLNLVASKYTCSAALTGETAGDCTGDTSLKKRSETDYGYDDPSRLTSSGITTQHQSAPGPVRGNLTSTARWLNSSNSFLTSYTNWFDTGEISASTNARNYATIYSYSTLYAGAYPTQVTDAKNHLTSSAYDFNTGLRTSITDPNNATTTYGYDNMWRLLNETERDSASTLVAETNISYNDGLAAPAPWVHTQQQIDSSRSTDDYVSFDGLGRPIRTARQNGESTLNWDMSETCYDNMGRTQFQSYPYQGTGWNGSYPHFCSGAGDSFHYDPLGRSTSTTHSDGTSFTTNYRGAAVQTLDEGNGSTNVQSVEQHDALGRVQSVCEVTSTSLPGISGTPASCGQDIAATGFLTTYSHDTLDNVLSVTQGGLNQRLFTYDSLSRMLGATNPESGITTYTYDANGNTLTRTRPAPNQTNPSAMLTTTYTYDALDRRLTTTYSDTPGASIQFGYDLNSQFGVTLFNAVGRKMTEYATDSNGNILTAGIFSYDGAGRIIDNSQCTIRTCPSLPSSGLYSLRYSYDYAGDLLTAIDGMSHTLTNSYNIAPRLIGLSTNLSNINHPGTLISGITYDARDDVKSDLLGNGISESYSYSPRGFLNTAAASAPSTGTPGQGQITINGTERVSGSLYDTGTVSVTVNGVTDSVTYGQGSTPTSLVLGLFNVINADSASPVRANYIGTNILYLSSRQNGTGTGYSFSVSSVTSDPTDFGAGTSSFSGTTLPVGAMTSGSSAATNTPYYLTVGHAPDGQITSTGETINASGQNLTWTLSYDPLNRLSTASYSNPQIPSSAGTYGYSVDRFGNRWQQNLTSGIGITEPSLSFDANNHIVGYSYDAAGNLLNDGQGHAFTYDEENRVVSMTSNTRTVTYIYDAEGRRARTTNNGTPIDFLYDLAGHKLQAINSTGGWNQGEVYASGRHIASYGYSTTFFAHQDQLGTERIRTDVSGAPLESCTNLPYGDNQQCSYSFYGYDISPIHFTGAIRDSEDSLDYLGARHYSSVLGRPLTADEPFLDQDALSPQSWNLTSYVRNNPLNNSDPTGNNCVPDKEGKFHDDGGPGETCAHAQDPANRGKGYNVSGCTGDDAVNCLVSLVGQYSSPSSVSEVGVNGMTGAATAEGLWELPGALADLWELFTNWRLVSKALSETPSVVRISGNAKTVKNGLGGLELSSTQKASVLSALRKATNEATVTVTKFSDGRVIVLTKTPGTDTGMLIVKVINQAGEPERVYQVHGIVEGAPVVDPK